MAIRVALGNVIVVAMLALLNYCCFISSNDDVRIPLSTHDMQLSVGKVGTPNESYVLSAIDLSIQVGQSSACPKGPGFNNKSKGCKNITAAAANCVGKGCINPVTGHTACSKQPENAPAGGSRRIKFVKNSCGPETTTNCVPTQLCCDAVPTTDPDGCGFFQSTAPSCAGT